MLSIRKLIVPALAAVLLIAQPAWAAPQKLPAGMTRLNSVEGIDEYALANGLQVLLIQDDSKPSTTVNVTYRVGSKNESYGETGMAHLLEHLLFKGTPGTPGVWAEFTKRGLRANGSTTQDRTNYFASLSFNEENLRWYLSWQADAMVNSFIARKDLDTEMTVVRNEMERSENDGWSMLLQRVMAASFDWHNYGKGIIGARADVEGVDIERLQNFYHSYYRPDNATLIVSGKFDPVKVRQWIAQYFGKLKKPARPIPALYTIDPAQDGERSVTVRRVGGSPMLVALYHIPGAASPDYAAASLLTLVLGDTPSGRLHTRIVEKQLASGAFAFPWGLQDPAVALMGLELGPDQDIDKAREALLDTIESLAREPVTAEELERARLKFLKRWELSFTNPEQIGVALSESVAQGDWRLFFLQRDRVRHLTLDDLNRVAASYLLRDNRTLGTYLPADKPSRAPAPQRVDVAAQLKDFKGEAAAAQVESFDATPANIEKRTQNSALSNGMKLSLLTKGARGQVVSGRLTLNLGDEKSLFGLEDVANATAAMLNKGTATMTRQQIQDRFDQLSAQVEFFGGATSAGASIKTKRENLPAVIALVGEVLRTANFPADALEEYRSQVLSSIEEQRKEPESVVETELARYGNPYPKGDVRYAASFDEMVENTKALTVEQLRAFHARFYGAQFAQGALVGDFEAAPAAKALETALGGWKALSAFTRVPNPWVSVAAKRLVFKTPDKQNAFMQVELALPLSDNDADYVPLLLGNYMLGQGGGSRLWVRIREKGGLSYDVGSSIGWNRFEANSPWRVTAIFAPQNRDKVESAFKEEVARALKDGFDAKELAEAKQGLLNFRRLARAQDGNLAGELASNLYLNRSFALTQKIDEQITAVSLEQVNAALRKYLQPERFVYGFGGDFKD